MVGSRGLAAVVIVLLMIESARAAFIDGNTLHQWCTKHDELVAAYVMGVADTLTQMMSYGILKRNNGSAICFGRGVRVKSEQLKDITCKYLRDNPEERHWEAGIITNAALQKAFTCPEFNPPTPKEIEDLFGKTKTLADPWEIEPRSPGACPPADSHAPKPAHGASPL